MTRSDFSFTTTLYWSWYILVESHCFGKTAFLWENVLLERFQALTVALYMLLFSSAPQATIWIPGSEAATAFFCNRTAQNSLRNLNSMLINKWAFNNGQWAGYKNSSKVMLLQECALKEPPEKQTMVVEKQALWKSTVVSPQSNIWNKTAWGNTYFHNFAETHYLQFHPCTSSKSDWSWNCLFKLKYLSVWSI